MWRGEHSVKDYLYLVMAALHYVDEIKFRLDSRYGDATRDTQRHNMRMPHSTNSHRIQLLPVQASQWKRTWVCTNAKWPYHGLFHCSQP